MKYLVMTEGSSELGMLEALIDKQIFAYDIEDLLYEKVHHARQIKNDIMAMVNQLPIDEKIHIIRVQDKFEKFETKNVSIRLEGITKIRTNPEFEILFIIYYDKMNEYMKVKSITKPSIFMKEKIDHDYKKQKKYVYNFFMKLSIEEIYSLFKNYDEMVNTQNKDEQTVISLLK